jgi:hypothetical protein
MPQVHRILRKTVPFLYERNWYNGQFEFKKDRAIAFCVAIGLVALLVSIALWMGKPIEYTQPR